MKTKVNLLLAAMLCCWSCSGNGDDVLTPTPEPEEKPKRSLMKNMKRY